MLPWVQVYSSLREHHKIDDLADELRLKTRYEAIGLVVSLWLWAVNNALDGDISKYRPRAIADAVGWKGKPDVLTEALVKVGLLDRNGSSICIHDWLEYTAMYVDKEVTRREKNRERMREYRSRIKDKQQSEAVTATEAVTVTKSDAPHNITIHNITEPYVTAEEDNNISQGGEALHDDPPDDVSGMFERFWKAWALISQKGREAAEEAWRDVILTEEDAERAIFRVPMYWSSLLSGSAKRVDAATWLRKGAWK